MTTSGLKSYRDFVSDIVDDPELYEQLAAAVPFPGLPELTAWFTTHGYELQAADAELLLANQEAVTSGDDQIDY
jgi:hypothetical protein